MICVPLGKSDAGTEISNELKAKKNFSKHASYSIASKQTTWTIANAESKRVLLLAQMGFKGAGYLLAMPC
ncbi:hypothetical protein EAI95_09955 [Streptococcus sp. bf_0095]|nr:hypothetical protein EAI95_09955 [Streptococcus sp. bf_0095]